MSLDELPDDYVARIRSQEQATYEQFRKVLDYADGEYLKAQV
jgi:hypothetical protein